jgi:hypothetical protein
VEETKTIYLKQMEDYRTELSTRAKAEIISSVFALWKQAPSPELKELNRLAWEATLWLPDDIALEVNKRLQNRPDAKDIKQILVDVKSLIHGQKSKLDPMDITHY